VIHHTHEDSFRAAHLAQLVDDKQHADSVHLQAGSRRLRVINIALYLLQHNSQIVPKARQRRIASPA
jgi:hypothetical protein